jgi:hypothetical protein
MAIVKLKDIVAKLNSKGQMDFLPSATAAEIGAFEVENKIHLPIQYREWLTFSDGGKLFLPAGIQLLGVANKPLINVDDTDKPNDQYIVIGTLASGDPILCEKGGEQISIYNHEAGRIEEDEAYPDFFTFISNLDEVLGIGG